MASAAESHAQRLNRIPVSEHFILSEFACPHCGTVKLHPLLVDRLERLRALIGQPLVITSGYRCPEHNRRVGGAPSSRHLFGDGADVAVPQGMGADRVVALAREAGFTGIGVYDDGHVHVDVRPGQAVFWDQRKKGGGQA